MENMPNFDDVLRYNEEFCDKCMYDTDKRQQKNKHCDCCCSDSNRKHSVNCIIESIALMEASLAHILNAEGEKLQKAIELACDTKELLAVNSSVQKTLIHITFLEQTLYSKLDKACSDCQCSSSKHGNCL